MKTAVLFMACATGLFAASFTNGSFELPGGAPIRLGLADGSTVVNGWTNQGGSQIYESSGQDGILAASGVYYVSFGHSGASGGTFTQSFDTTAGTTYFVDYSVSLQQGLGTVSMQVEALDGVTQLASAMTTIDQIAWVSGTQLQFTATSGTSTLRFTDLGGPGNGSSNTALDTVTLQSDASSVPEPSSCLLVAPALLALSRFRRRS